MSCKISLNPDRELQAYIIGVAIGDGNLTNPNGRATRLRITCDKKYPLLIKKIVNSLRQLFPCNKIGIIDRPQNCLDISVYSNHLEKLLGWQVGKGTKIKQQVSIPDWIIENKQYKINCIRGLIETDGSIYFDRKYKMMIFTTAISRLANDFYNMVVSLGYNPHIYNVRGNRNIKYNFTQLPAYHVRLSKNVQEFIDLVKIEKT